LGQAALLLENSVNILFMNLYEFYRKSRRQQVEMIARVGQNIAVRTEPKQRIELYFLDGQYFAELCYNRMTNKLAQVRVFKNVDLLEPYLAQINLPVAKS
jgi:hypothetical protein